MRKYQYSILLVVGLICSCNNKPNKAQHVVDKTTNEPKESTEVTKKDARKTILFFGDSLTAGYGLDQEEAFPSLVQKRLDSLGMNYTAINGGLSGETSAGGKGRIDWVLEQSVDIFVLELGANDMLRGLDINSTRQNLKDILNIVQAKYPAAELIVAGMMAPPNMGENYSNEFKSIFSDLAEEYEAGLIPFLLSGLEGKEGLDIGDGKHPNAKGQKIVMENVWKVLEGYL